MAALSADSLQYGAVPRLKGIRLLRAPGSCCLRPVLTEAWCCAPCVPQALQAHRTAAPGGCDSARRVDGSARRVRHAPARSANAGR
jgi:hypothetical protein